MKIQTRSRRYGILLSVLLLIFLSIFFRKSHQSSPSDSSPLLLSPTPVSSPQNAFPFHPQIFYDERLVKEGITQAERSSLYSPPIKAGVVSHHLLASPIIAEFFQSFHEQEVKTLIVIGPNHQEVGKGKILTSNWSWGTAFGIVENDQELTQILTQAGAILDPETLTQEHSVAALMPFIKYYFPDTKVVPLVLSKKLTSSEVEALSVFIAQHMDTQTVLIGSIDFSHYLSAAQAAEKDQQTLRFIQEKNYSRLATLNSDYLDSTSSLLVLMTTLKNLQVNDSPTVLSHHSSADFIQDSSLPVTTYYHLLWK